MATRVSHKSLLLALLLIFFISSPVQARSIRGIVRKRTLLVVEKNQESRNSWQYGGGSDGDGLVDMDYNCANKKRPIHNRK
ncbi:unnamed protein product [Eruca vesicaria subsp. sativa]|uniref:Uncharacterized protein n=1 Tax=Eruca vesicaria subsp. sativa TaxID=29727 RepID=A0ABC8M6K0_ERUVS|nr:unnamed protein product [Eruca vesicaria subsp. sativa]